MPLVPEIKNWNIYKMTSPTDRVYIGMTSNIIKRKAAYNGLDCKSQPLLFKSIKKYGLSNLNFEIIDEFDGTLSEAKSKEMFWIRTHMSNYCKYPEMRGMNLTDGGQGTLGYKLLDVQKEAISIKNKGFKHTDEAKRKIGEASKGNTYSKGTKKSPEHIEVLRKVNIGNKYNLGRKQSQEEKEKRASKLRNKDRGQDFKNKLSKILTIKLGKKIQQYDVNNVFIKEYDSISIAEKELGVWRSVIKHALKNGTLSTKLKSYFKYKI
jgi:group I intron endonuclease